MASNLSLINNPSLSELTRIFDPSTTPSQFFDSDRLEQDLDKSVRENHHLSRQMDQWKKQLADSTAASEADLEGEDPESPFVLKVKQEQAYRSVGALQLRVEELTLEVTKVNDIHCRYQVSDNDCYNFPAFGRARHPAA
jgi:hypothetical protein